MNKHPASPKIFVDEVFGVGTFYRLVRLEGCEIQSLHLICGSDGTDAGGAGSVIIEHCDIPAPVTGPATVGSFDPTVDSTNRGWGSPGAATTVGASEGRYWKQDMAVGTLTVTRSTGSGGGARASYGNQAAEFTRAVFTVTSAGRMILAGSGAR